MNKIFTKPILTGAIVASLAVFNIFVFGQTQMTTPEVEALGFILKMIGGATLLILTGINVWAAIKNKNYAQLKETLELNERLINSLKVRVSEIELENTKLLAKKNHFEIENERVEEENWRLKGQLAERK